jgi:hypothetical protein
MIQANSGEIWLPATEQGKIEDADAEYELQRERGRTASLHFRNMHRKAKRMKR